MTQGDQWLPSCTHSKSKGCLQLSCLEPHSPHLLHYPSRKTMFQDFFSFGSNPTTPMEAAGFVQNRFSHSWSGTTTPSSCFWEDKWWGGAGANHLQEHKFYPLSCCSTSLSNTAWKMLSSFTFLYRQIRTPHSSLQLPEGKSAALQKHENK